MEATRSGRSLLAASARPRAGVLLAGCAILVAVLGVLFAHRSTADAFDHAVDSPVITVFAGHPVLALRLASPGTTGPAVVVSVVIAVACLITRRLRGGVLATAPISARSSTQAGTPRPSSRWRPRSPCCCSRPRGRPCRAGCGP